jgi:hypothetical protein
MSKDFENNNGNKEPNNFGLPDGYFQNSAGSILNKIEWMDEHKQYPHLSSLKKETGFVAPGNYFETSEANLELLEYPNLLKYKNDSGFIVPQNYFDELEVNELSKQLSDNQNELAGFDVLNSIEKKNVFAVSENYFTSSEQKITFAIYNLQSASDTSTVSSVGSVKSVVKESKVIHLFSTKLWYSAAAAVFAITLGIWIYNQYFKPVVAIGDCGTLACVDKKDILKAKIESLDEEQLYKTVDTKKLEENLQNTSKGIDKNTPDSASTEDILDEI